MSTLKKKWRELTAVILILAYLVLVVFLRYPLTTYLGFVALTCLILILVFLGTFVGTLGVLIQVFLKKEKWALPLYKTAYKLRTINATILASYGLLLLRNNDPEEALACFKRAYDNTNYFLSKKTMIGNMAIAYWKLGDLGKAIQGYEDILSQYAKETVEVDIKNTEESYLKAFVDNQPILYPQDYTTLGYLYLLHNHLDEALFYTKAALIKKPSYAAAIDNLGQIALHQGQSDEAKAFFEEALSLNPALPDSLYYLGVLLKEEGNMTLAKSYLEKAKTCKLDGLNTISIEMIDAALSSI